MEPIVSIVLEVGLLFVHYFLECAEWVICRRARTAARFLEVLDILISILFTHPMKKKQQFNLMEP